MENKKIFIGNLPYSATEELFAELFTTIEIDSLELLKIEDGRPSGFGVMVINSDITEALATFNSTEIDGRLISATEYITY